MKVRELVAMLAKADPDDVVAIDADAKCLLLLNQRPGMFQPLDGNEACAATLTECDKEFLRALRVQFSAECSLNIAMRSWSKSKDSRCQSIEPAVLADLAEKAMKEEKALKNFYLKALMERLGSVAFELKAALEKRGVPRG